MRIARHTRGFTVIELLVGLQITSIVLSAVAALAFAMSVAARDADDTIHTQTELRYATLRIGELIRTCRLLCAAPGNDLVLWTADYNHDDRIDVNEVIYVEYDDPNDSLKLREFDLKNSPTVLTALELPETEPVLATLAQTGTKAALVREYTPLNKVRRITMLQGCSNVEFTADQNPPRTRRLTISFDLTENNAVHHYEIEATVRASAQHLLSGDGSTLVSDDD
jgi:type II secretory pathway pseudopilin PulG